MHTHTHTHVCTHTPGRAGSWALGARSTCLPARLSALGVLCIYFSNDLSLGSALHAISLALGSQFARKHLCVHVSGYH